MKLNAYWTRCTPDWVAVHNACGTTVRRPILEPVLWKPEDKDIRNDYFQQVGHEHLMAMPGFSSQVLPVDHKDGAPR